MKPLLDLLEKFRKLAQPYFFPADRPSSAWRFLILIGSLFAIAASSSIISLAVLTSLFGEMTPIFQEIVIRSLPEWITRIWYTPLGLSLAALWIVGVSAFVRERNQLRQGRWLPWLLMGVIIVLILVVNGINVGISYIARDVENALVKYEIHRFWFGIAVYALCLVLALPVRGIQGYLIPKFSLIWREWISSRYLSLYLSGQTYYKLRPNEEMVEDIDNPDQRISEDLHDFTFRSISIILGLFTSIISLLSFILVLWGISGRLAMVLLCYSLAGTAIVIYASRKLVFLNYQQLKLEADFRYGLVHIRDSAESIAFYRGERLEREEGMRRLDKAIKNNNRLIIWESIVGVIQRSYDYFSRFLPWLVIAPIYFAKKLDYGAFSQAGIAFSQVFYALGFIVNNIESLARFSASINRLETFQAELFSAQATLPAARETSNDVTYIESDNQMVFTGDLVKKPDFRILLGHLNVIPPNTQRILINDLNCEVRLGERLLIMGPSGCGKTSLLRVICGLWPAGGGFVDKPNINSIMFIPQKPYMLLGTLREQLCYPTLTNRFIDEQLQHSLIDVGLESFLTRFPDFDVRHDWSRLLSIGEQQRLAFARLLINSPQFVLLDEATSSLDLASENHLYDNLISRDIGLITVSHRSSLEQYHDRLLELDGRGGWRITPITAHY